MAMLILPVLFLYLHGILAVPSYLTAANNASGAFIDGKIVTVVYTANYICSPKLAKLYPNQKQITNLTDCGLRVAGNLVGTLPVWALTPSFAGLSLFGYASFNATPEGFPTYNGNVIITDCGADGTLVSCPFIPKYRYDTNTTALQRAYGIYNGIGGLPEGLLPMPAFDYVLLNDYGGSPIPWYVVFVRVYDPNIYPNATTGTCAQVAPSNLSNPIANCLTSFDALRKATGTKNSGIAIANKNNPAWTLRGSPLNQVVIVSNPNVTGISNLLYPNSNIYLFFKVNKTDFYGQTQQNNSRNSAQIAAYLESQSRTSELWLKSIGVFVFAIIAINVWWFKIKRMKKGKRNG